jgi:hypothetical protein
MARGSPALGLVMKAAFGLSGLFAALVYYACLKDELEAQPSCLSHSLLEVSVLNEKIRPREDTGFKS